MSLIKKSSHPAYSGWVDHDAGYEYTRAPSIIQHTLKWLRDKKRFITLLHKGYQSGGTLLVSFNEHQLLIDRPKDWPGTHTHVRVVFRNSAKLWCHFTSSVASLTPDNLYLQFPQELFMLQRRAHFRVVLPEGSKATFMYNRKKCKLNMKDISVGGMLLFGRPDKDLPAKGYSIKDIAISIPSDDAVAGAEGGTLRFKIKTGDIVRTFMNEKLHQFFLAVQFYPARPEEERIMKYIRQRELAILRKGVQD